MKRDYNFHGYSKSPTYQAWRGMKRRCYDQNDIAFKYYGGRGVHVCLRWFKFQNFLEDMGEKPDGLTLDRIDNNGHYMPSNCRWSTQAEQNRNRVQLHGEQKPGSKLITEQVTKIRNSNLPQRTLAAEFGVSQSVIYRIQRRKNWKHVP